MSLGDRPAAPAPGVQGEHLIGVRAVVRLTEPIGDHDHLGADAGRDRVLSQPIESEDEQLSTAQLHPDQLIVRPAHIAEIGKRAQLRRGRRILLPVGRRIEHPVKIARVLLHG